MGIVFPQPRQRIFSSSDDSKLHFLALEGWRRAAVDQRDLSPGMIDPSIDPQAPSPKPRPDRQRVRCSCRQVVRRHRTYYFRI